MDERLREELKSMAAEDGKLRQELLDRGEMGGGYAPRMETLHRRNAARLKEIIVEHGWPDSDLVGEDARWQPGLLRSTQLATPNFNERH